MILGGLSRSAENGEAAIGDLRGRKRNFISGRGGKRGEKKRRLLAGSRRKELIGLGERKGVEERLRGEGKKNASGLICKVEDKDGEVDWVRGGGGGRM